MLGWKTNLVPDSVFSETKRQTMFGQVGLTSPSSLELHAFLNSKHVLQVYFVEYKTAEPFTLAVQPNKPFKTFEILSQNNNGSFLFNMHQQWSVGKKMEP